MINQRKHNKPIIIESSFKAQFHLKTSQFLKRPATNFSSSDKLKLPKTGFAQKIKHIKVEQLLLEKITN